MCNLDSAKCKFNPPTKLAVIKFKIPKFIMQLLNASAYSLYYFCLKNVLQNTSQQSNFIT